MISVITERMIDIKNEVDYEGKRFDDGADCGNSNVFGM